MATAETVDLGPPHEPKPESINAFNQIEHELKKQLIHIRHDHNKHEPEYFAAVAHLSDKELASFSDADFVQVRAGVSAYGIHIFGKLRIPAMPDSGPAYIHFRLFSTGTDDPVKLHSIHTEEKEDPRGGFVYRAIFTKDDPLEWFET